MMCFPLTAATCWSFPTSDLVLQNIAQRKLSNIVEAGFVMVAEATVSEHRIGHWVTLLFG